MSNRFEVTRRRSLQAIGSGMALGMAGCLGSGEGEFPQDGAELALIIPYPSGGGFDFYTRTQAPYFEEYFQELYDTEVETLPQNISGGGGVTATNHTWEADPDGRTMQLFHGTNFPLNQVVMDVGYDVEEFVYTGQIAYNIKTLATRPDGPSGWDEFESEALDSGGFSVATSGHGGAGHIGGLVLADELGVESEFVHFEGIAEGVASVRRGEADFVINNYGQFFTEVEDGELQYVAAFADAQPAETTGIGDYEIDLGPDAGIPGWEMVAHLTNTIRVWVLPPETPEEIAEVWEEVVWEATTDPDFQEEMLATGRPVEAQDADSARNNVMAAYQTMLEEEDFLNEIIDT